MKKAISEVVTNRSSVNAAAKKYDIPEPTLRRYLKKGDRTRELEEHEFPIEELKQYIVDIDRRALGLTKSQFGRLCFDFAESKGITHKFNKEKRAAGRDFIEAFMKESKRTLRKPEATSVARLMAFNKINVGKFFDVLKDLRIAHSFQAANIYNADETGFSTVPTRTLKVPLMVHTSVCTISAAGNFVPPFFISSSFKRMNLSFMVGATPGSEGVAHESGWMTAEKFINYLHHFAKFAHPRKDNPVLMIMDNHASHVTLEAIQELASIAGKAYFQVANARTAIKAFEATGIEPFNQAIFNEVDFASAQTTDMPIETVESDAFPTSAEPQVIRLTTTANSSNKHIKKTKITLPSMYLTSTPVKEALVERRMEKDEKEEKRKQRLMNKDKKTKTQKMKKVAQQEKKKTVRQVFFSSDDSDSIEVQYVNTDDDMDTENEEEQD
ncbi:hypothetical protein NQ314_007070 [Rhamnusium bicolor]|uniref:DDE-1 domain-containing protein n=1 Tax=Rhamnusium bicolor TaxID=1586634 RepID=A0AAV8YUH5_9CUCU|nr:hypothetical protein NQ314_007070 [Rhamnusium bicolor]